jgi:YegS/Rv2252/BmrU family lipid kinase
MIKSIALLYNRKAGKGKAVSIAMRLQDLLKKRGVEFTCYAEDWPECFETYSDVFLVGGDGTLNYFINRYPDIQIPVSLFKGGSGNDFAWKLYGDSSLEEYLEIVFKQHAKPVDAGYCNGRLFINGVGIGFDGAIVKSMGTKRMLSAGHLSYLLTVIKHILFYRESNLKVEWNNTTITEKCFLLTIANGSRYGGGFVVAPLSRINDSLLDIIVIRKVAPLLRLIYLPKLTKGKHLSLSIVSSFKTSKIKISSSAVLPAHYDGEFMEAAEFDIRLLPGKFLFRY